MKLIGKMFIGIFLIYIGLYILMFVSALFASATLMMMD